MVPEPKAADHTQGHRLGFSHLEGPGPSRLAPVFRHTSSCVVTAVPGPEGSISLREFWSWRPPLVKHVSGVKHWAESSITASHLRDRKEDGDIRSISQPRK